MLDFNRLTLTPSNIPTDICEEKCPWSEHVWGMNHHRLWFTIRNVRVSLKVSTSGNGNVISFHPRHKTWYELWNFPVVLGVVVAGGGGGDWWLATYHVFLELPVLHIWMELIYLPEVVSASSFLVFKHNLKIKIAATYSLTHCHDRTFFFFECFGMI